MAVPFKNEIWYVDLSPSIGNEIGGVRPCRIEKRLSADMVQVVPNIYDERIRDFRFAPEHTRSISIQRLREKII